MKKIKFHIYLSKAFIMLSALSLLYVAALAIYDPQKVMDLVNVKLNNNDAYSSIRGVYGGVGCSLFLALLYAMKKHLVETVLFLGIFWGFYALSRVYTIFHEGALGAFGNQWLLIETLFSFVAIILFIAGRKNLQAAEK